MVIKKMKISFYNQLQENKFQLNIDKFNLIYFLFSKIFKTYD